MRVLLGLTAVAVVLALSPRLRAEDAGEDSGPAAADGATAEDVLRPADAAVEDAAAGDSGREDGSVVEDAAAEDAGADDAASSCGEVPSTGECQGDLLRFCQNNRLVEVDCPRDPELGGPTTTCGLVDCDDQPYPSCFGYWCVARLGAACDPLPCDVSLGQGCLGGVCAASSACDPASYQPTCAGSVATYCSVTVSDRDCAAGGQPYTCAAPANDHTAACVGLEGADCGTFGEIDYLCASGLRCDQGLCTARAPGVDAGSGADASRRDSGASADDDDDAGGCGCSAAGRASGFLLLLGAGLGWRRRLRTR